MRSILRFLLVVSLLVNLAGLVLLSGRVSEAAPAGSAAARKADPPRTTGDVPSMSVNVPSIRAGAVASRVGFDGAAADLRAIRAHLEAQGLPEAVMSTIIHFVALERNGYDEARKAFSAGKGAAEGAKKLSQVSQDAREQVLREVGLFPSEEAKLVRDLTVRYGDLPRETGEALRKLESEYSEKSDRELAEALPALLGPGQVDDYLRYNSLLARNLQFNLASIDVTEAEYGALLDAIVAREGTNAPELTKDEVMRHTRTIEAIEDYRRILGDGRFLELLPRFEENLAKTDAVFRGAGLPESLRTELFLEAFKVHDFEKRRNEQTIDAVRAAGMESDLAKAERERTIRVTEELRQTIIVKAGLTPAQVTAFDAAYYGPMLERMRKTAGYGYRLGVRQIGHPGRAW